MSKIYDCNLCMHKVVCDLWVQKIANSDPKSKPDDGDDFISCPSVSYGCRHFDSKRRYICVDDVKGPGPDPKGAEGEPGQEGSIFQDLMDIFDGYIALKRAKEATQCGDASGRGND